MTTEDLFQFNIEYDVASSSFNAPAQKNGNISRLTWQVKGQVKQSYGFDYDHLNRLTQATYGEIDGLNLDVNNHYSSNYSYDNRGNIATLDRQGFLLDGTFAQIDDLTYSYGSSSNQLSQISDSAPTASKDEGFTPGLTSQDYTYDANGNMNYDPNKEMNIRYNHLNLPEYIEFENCDIIEFTYDAVGVKLTKTVKNGGTQFSTHDYAGSIEYKNEFIDAVYHSEGRVYFEQGQSRYEYAIRDHLGNTRLCFTDRDGDGLISTTPSNLEILEETHYYPFGMQMRGNWIENRGRENNYLYNGKELNEDFGLDWLDYGARWYDPAIGRWNAVDPLGEMTPNWTAYRYGFNNPIRMIDPDGMSEEKYSYNDGYGTWSSGTTSARTYALSNSDEDQNDPAKESLLAAFSKALESLAVKNAEGIIAKFYQDPTRDVGDLDGGGTIHVEVVGYKWDAKAKNQRKFSNVELTINGEKLKIEEVIYNIGGDGYNIVTGMGDYKKGGFVFSGGGSIIGDHVFEVLGRKGAEEINRGAKSAMKGNPLDSRTQGYIIMNEIQFQRYQNLSSAHSKQIVTNFINKNYSGVRRKKLHTWIETMYKNNWLNPEIKLD